MFATLSDTKKSVAFSVLLVGMALAAYLAIRSVGVASGLIMMLVATSRSPISPSGGSTPETLSAQDKPLC